MEHLVLLIDEPEKIQRALPVNSRDARTLQDRLVSACRAISECDYALQIPHSYEGLVAAFRQSIATAEANERTNMSQRLNYANTNTTYTHGTDRQNLSCSEDDAYYTNRIYKGGRDRNSNYKSQNYERDDRRDGGKCNDDSITCFICKQKGHRSIDSRHPDAERSKQYEE
ncbi:hypothetical protein K3495_g9156 [Podosphaera aphanis]|nr:hypothetical protein K3495_g9156 [Podosphaera aphanis]